MKTQSLIRKLMILFCSIILMAAFSTPATTDDTDGTGSVSVTVYVNWLGDERESATVHLLANETEVDSVTLTADDNWTYTFKNLAQTDSDGKTIEYKPEEDSIDGYTTAIAGDINVGFTVINTQLISVNVTKVWVGAEGTSATVHLLENGTEVDSATLPFKNSWKYSFNGLAKVDSDENEITYTVTEDEIDGYSSDITGNAENGFTVTNTQEPIDIPVTKYWVGDPASSATVHLLANGTEVDSLTLTADNNWTDTFEDLAQADSNGDITYTLTEDEIEGYSSEISGNASNGFTVTNTKTIDIPVTKEWVGAEGTSATMHLFANGTEVDSATLTADDSWTYTFEDLAQVDNYGNEITYTLTEDAIDGYSSEITGDAENGFTVTNTQEPIDIPVTKEWVGAEGTSATVHLLANGSEVDSAALTADNNWTYTFTDLDQADSDGNEITYTLTEDSIDGYESSITGDASSGFTVTNTKKISIPVTKKWIGDAGESATVHLLANGSEVDSATLTADDSWTYTFEDLALADSDGNEITYTLTEDSIDGYESSITGDADSGFTVTNIKTISIPVKKVWTSGTTKVPVTVELLRNGNAAGITMTLDESNEWEGTFAGQPECDSTGTKYIYTVKEITDDYTWSVSGSADEGFVITNGTREITAEDPSVRKTITGDNPSKDSRFYFTMTAEPEKSTLPTGMTEMPVPTAAGSSQSMTISVDGEGSGEFGDIVFTEPGTYVYEVKEENTGADGYDYDDTIYEVRYVVQETDDSTTGTYNALTCERTILKDGVVQSGMTFTFTNKYTAPDSDEDNDNQNRNIPDKKGNDDNDVRTGDMSNIGLWIVVLAASAAAITIGLLLRKRLSNRN